MSLAVSVQKPLQLERYRLYRDGTVAVKGAGGPAATPYQSATVVFYFTVT